MDLLVPKERQAAGRSILVRRTDTTGALCNHRRVLAGVYLSLLSLKFRFSQPLCARSTMPLRAPSIVHALHANKTRRRCAAVARDVGVQQGMKGVGIERHDTSSLPLNTRHHTGGWVCWARLCVRRHVTTAFCTTIPKECETRLYSWLGGASHFRLARVIFSVVVTT